MKLLQLYGVSDLREAHVWPGRHLQFAIPHAGEAVVPPLQIPTTIEVTPSPVVLTLGHPTEQLTAILRDQNGQQIHGVTFTWSSTDPLTVFVSSSGLVSRVATGLAEVTAHVGALASDPVPVSVGDVVADSIGLDGPPVFEEISGMDQHSFFTSQYTPNLTVRAFVRNAANEIIRNKLVDWHFDPQGNTACVSFAPNGNTALIQWDENNNSFDINEDGILINATTGEGESTVSSGTLNVFVNYGVLTSQVVTPDTLHLVETGPRTGQLTVNNFDQYNNPWPTHEFGAFVSDNPAIASVDGTGLVSWELTGVTQVRAFTDVGEPPVETPSTNHCTVTCT